MKFEEFIILFKQEYLNINKINDNVTINNLLDLKVKIKDEWIILPNTIINSFNLIGYSIIEDNSKLIFNRINPIFSTNIKSADEIISINNFTPKEGLMLVPENKIDIKIKRNEDILLEKISIPQTDYSIPQNNFYINDNNIPTIIINSFDDRVIQMINYFIVNFDHISFDLRKCLGGNINKMLKVLYKSNLNIKNDIKFINSTKEIIKIKKEGYKDVIIDLLVSNTTASSAEIFLNIIRNNYNGNVYGEITAGKLVLQKKFVVEEKTIWLPVMKYIKYVNSYDGKKMNYFNDKFIPDKLKE